MVDEVRTQNQALFFVLREKETLSGRKGRNRREARREGLSAKLGTERALGTAMASRRKKKEKMK